MNNDLPAEAPQRWPASAAFGTVGLVALTFFLSQLFLLPFAGEVSGPSPFSCSDEPTVISSRYLLVSFIATIGWQGLTLLLAYWTVRRYGGTWASLGYRPLGIGRTALVAFGALLSLYVITGLYALVSEALPCVLQPHGQQLPEKLFEVPYLAALAFVSVVFVAPVVEETLFRGLLFNALGRRLGILAGALISGLIFSAFHFNPGLFIPFSVIGAVFALVYWRTGSIFVNMSAHCAFNLVSFTVLLLFPGARS